jgi:uncharacterized membrane protein (UPF0127 family)
MKLIVNNQHIPLEIKDTPISRNLGMMGRENLIGGMLFIFDGVKERSFWMKDCLIPLDIFFITNDIVTECYYNCKPCISEPCESYYGVCNKVLECKSGDYKIMKGDKVSLT